MSDEQNAKPETQDNTQSANATPSDELSDEELSNISGGGKPKGDQQVYLEIKLNNVFISGVQSSG